MEICHFGSEDHKYGVIVLQTFNRSSKTSKKWGLWATEQNFNMGLPPTPNYYPDLYIIKIVMLFHMMRIQHISIGRNILSQIGHIWHISIGRKKNLSQIWHTMDTFPMVEKM